MTVKELKNLFLDCNDDATVGVVGCCDDSPFDFYEIKDVVRLQSTYQNLVIIYPE
jgi:hypothetical protein